MFLDVVWTQPPSTCFVVGLNHPKTDFSEASRMKRICCARLQAGLGNFCMHYKKPKEHDLHV